MTTVDLVIVAFTLLLALYGYSRGFLVGVLSLAGFAVGAYLGTRIGPLVLNGGTHSPYAPLFGLLGALLAGGVLASGLEGIGLKVRGLLRIPGFRLLDGLLGAVLTGCVALGIAWIIGAVVLESAQTASLRADFRRSEILRRLDEILPPSGSILRALAHLDPLPSLQAPVATVPPPSPAILKVAGVRAARRSVVRIEGTACGLGVEGSGWIVAPGLVVTNAHVVAGESDTTVRASGGGTNGNVGLPARLMAFDPHNDVAVLRVPGLNRPVLHLAAAGTRKPVAILGFPLDGPFNAQPARLGSTQPVETQDAYGNGPVTRTITELRGLVRPGNSGGPLIDSAGRVVGTVFASISGGASAGAPGGFAIPNGIVLRQLRIARARGHAVPAGACAG